MEEAGPHALARRFMRHLDRTGLIPAGSRALVAVSGGIDSVTLLHLLRFHATGIVPLAAHFDHRMRLDSEADAHWVRGLCRAWHVPLESRVATAELRTEAEARTARYAFLREAAAGVSADVIVTAHHADDQAETVLFRMLRGGDGLWGIPARRGVIVRPLLPFRRSAIESYALANHLGYRRDPTNVRLDRARNRIRHIALPALEAAMPGATTRLIALAARERESENAWKDVIRSVLERVVIARSETRIQLARTPLLRYHRHIRGRVLRQVVRDLGGVPGRAGTRAAVSFIDSGASGRGIEMAGGLRLERHFDQIVIGVPSGPGGGGRALEIPSSEPGTGEATIGGRKWLAAWSDTAEDAPLAAAFDPTALRFPLELREWRAGDRIRLGGGTRKLKKLFAERRIPRYERSRVPVLASADGRILWVAGVAREAGTEPGPGARVFHIRVKDDIDG